MLENQSLEMEEQEDDLFIGEIVSEDSFAFTLISCHCSGSVIGRDD